MVSPCTWAWKSASSTSESFSGLTTATTNFMAGSSRWRILPESLFRVHVETAEVAVRVHDARPERLEEQHAAGGPRLVAHRQPQRVAHLAELESAAHGRDRYPQPEEEPHAGGVAHLGPDHLALGLVHPHAAGQVAQHAVRGERPGAGEGRELQHDRRPPVHRLSSDGAEVVALQDRGKAHGGKLLGHALLVDGVDLLLHLAVAPGLALGAERPPIFRHQAPDGPSLHVEDLVA